LFCRGIVTTEALDGSKDVTGGFGPSERFGIGLVSLDERGDVFPEGGYAAIDAANLLRIYDCELVTRDTSPSCCRQNGEQDVREVADQTDTKASPDGYDDGHLPRFKFHASSDKLVRAFTGMREIQS
jgi:hypothetical protein